MILMAVLLVSIHFDIEEVSYGISSWRLVNEGECASVLGYFLSVGCLGVTGWVETLDK